MSIKPEPQSIINAGQSFVIKLTADGILESGVMRVLINGKKRAFTLIPGDPLAEEQPVNVLGVIPVSVQSGWGSAADVGATLIVEVDTKASTPRTIQP